MSKVTFLTNEDKAELQEQISNISVQDSQTIPIIDAPSTADYVVGEEAYLYASGLVNTRDLHWQERLRISQYGSFVQSETWDADKIIKVKKTSAIPNGTKNQFFFTTTLGNEGMIDDTRVDSKAYVWNKPTNPETVKNILVVGDSYTAKGFTWLKYMIEKHMGGLSNYKFIGRKAVGGFEDAGNVKCEATAYYSWDNYLCEPSKLPSAIQINPFWDADTGAVNIKKYVDTYAGENANLDYVICLLGINARAYFTYWEEKYDQVEEDAINSVYTYAKEFIDKVHTAYPNCKILLAGYPLAPLYDGVNNSKWMEMFGRNDFVHLINDKYKQLATEYPTFVRFAHTTSGVGVNNAYEIAETEINSAKCKTLTDDLHMNAVGHQQLAEVMWRSFVGLTNM